MPTYDYVCRACDHRFEEFQSMKANPLRKCPSCGKLKLERLIGPGAGLIFRGSGFYETDYRSESYKKAAEAEKNAGSSEGSGGSEKSDSGSETSTESKNTSSSGEGSSSESTQPSSG